MTIPHDSLHSSNASNEPGSPASWQAASIASEVLQCLGREGPWGCSFKRPSLHLTGSNKLAIQSLQIYPNLPNTSQSFGCFSYVFFFSGKKLPPQVRCLEAIRDHPFLSDLPRCVVEMVVGWVPPQGRLRWKPWDFWVVPWQQTDGSWWDGWGGVLTEIFKGFLSKDFGIFSLRGCFRST